MAFSTSAYSTRITIAIVSIFLILIGWTLTGAALPILTSIWEIWEMAGRPGEEKENMPEERNGGPFKPTPADVAVARAMLFRAKKVPAEIAVTIIELAEYWPHSRTTINYGASTIPTARDALAVRAGRPDSENRLLIRSPPIGLQYPPHQSFTTGRPFMEVSEVSEIREEATPDHFKPFLKVDMPLLEHPVRKIVFTIDSEDQGWTHQRHNTYESSWTWFEAGLERYDVRQECKEGKPGTECPHRPGLFLPDCQLKSVQPCVVTGSNGQPKLQHDMMPHMKFSIQRNKVAAKKRIVHTVTWSWLDDIDPASLEADKLEEAGRGRASGTGEFVRSLKVGDVVTVWAKARFAGWVNYVHTVSMEVYWAF